MSRTVIYTACFGDHDKPVDLPEHAFPHDEVELHCFTDSEDLARTLTSWNVHVMRPRFLQSRMDAKWYKMSGAHLFPQTWLSIYLDSSVRFRKTEGFVEHCHQASLQSDDGLAFFLHPEGQRTIVEEAEFSMSFGKYAGEPIRAQARHYVTAGFPGGTLLAGGCIVRRNVLGRHAIARFEKAWFDECVHWSVQDQVSLPYVLWKEDIDHGILPGNIYNNDFFHRIWSGSER